MYDYFLGGTVNLQVDRVAADSGLAVVPEIRDVALANRRFMVRAVRHVARQGLTQFLDIGSGLPTQENVHQVVGAVHPSARTLYVDNDPSVPAQARELIGGDPNARYLQADLRDPEHLLTHPETLAHLDLSRPVCVLLVAVLHFVQDAEDPYGLVARLMAAVPPGSHLILSHASRTDVDPELWEVLQAGNRSRLAVPITYRTAEEIGGFLDMPGLRVIGPGLTDVRAWQPDGEKGDLAPARMRVFGAVARKDS
jgi:SAM-dependent methyltransferase